MKLKNSFITHEVDGEHITVAVGGESFSGIVRSNATAAFIVELLKKGASEEELVDALCGRYEAPREVIARDAAAILKKLRSIGALEE